MEKEIKVPVIILTRDPANGQELADYITSRFQGREMHIAVCTKPEEVMDHLTVKHYNIVVVDYDEELYRGAERLIYDKPDKMAVSLVLSSAYDVQFIFRKPSEHIVESKLDVQPGMAELVVEDRHDHESVSMMISELLRQREDRKTYNHKNYIMAAALIVFFLIMAVIIF